MTGHRTGTVVAGTVPARSTVTDRVARWSDRHPITRAACVFGLLAAMVTAPTVIILTTAPAPAHVRPVTPGPTP